MSENKIELNKTEAISLIGIDSLMESFMEYQNSDILYYIYQHTVMDEDYEGNLTVEVNIPGHIINNKKVIVKLGLLYSEVYREWLEL